MRYLVLIGLIVGGLLGYYVLWSHLADQMASRADAWIEAQRRQGRDVGYESRRLWGFPYRLSLTMKKAHWSDPRLPLAPRLEIEDITAHLQLWNQEHVIFELSGRQKAGWSSAGTGQQVSLAADRFRASLVVDGAGNWLRIATDLAGVQLHNPTNGIWRGDWTAEKLLLHARRAGNVPPSFDLAMQADKLTLPPQAENALGRVLHTRLTGNLRGSIHGSTPEDILTTWRESGGVIDFSTIAMQWGKFSMNGNGSLTLDRDFRPLAAISGTTNNGVAVIDALRGASLIDTQQASAARRAIEQTPARIEKDITFYKTTLTAQDGRLSVDAVPLLSLPSVFPDR